MFESALVSGFLTFIVLVAFMVACPVLCFMFSIFSDSINLNGPFEKIGIAFVNLIFIPFVLFFKIVDAITSPFIEPKMKSAIENRNNLRA
jgi:predicted tellurium resistance membrane protein TerC